MSDIKIVRSVGFPVGALADEANGLGFTSDWDCRGGLGLGISVDGDFVGVADFVTEDNVVGMAPRVANGIPIEAVIREGFLKIGGVIREVKGFVAGVEKSVADTVGRFHEIGNAEGEEIEIVPIVGRGGVGWPEGAIGAGAESGD